MQSTMTVGRKFALTGALLLAMTVLLGAVALIGFGGLDGSLHSLTDDSMAGVSSSSLVESALLELRGDTWRHIASMDAADMTNMEHEIARLKQDIETNLHSVEATIFTDEERQIESAIRPALQRYYQAWDGAIDLSRASRNEEAYKKYVTEATAAYKAAQAAIRAETDYNRQSGVRNGAAARVTSDRLKTLIALILLVSVVGGSIVLFFVVRSLNHALGEAVSELSDGAREVAAAANHVASSSQSLAQGASEQAASLEETSAAGEEISSMARRNAESSSVAAQNMAEAAERIHQANSNLDLMVTSMNEINVSSEKISKIIKVIDEIAFQTNILALNAAVEAARAGEAGMGFAVVADEVRSLAQRCTSAARDTATLIEDSIAKTNDGKLKLDHVATAVRSITDSAAKAKALVEDMKVGSEEQARGIEQVSKALAQMDQVTQSTAASAEEGSAASQQLSAQASSVRAVVERLAALAGVDTGFGSGGNEARAHKGRIDLLGD